MVRSHRMRHRPRLTIGLPVHDGADYLAEAVESVLTQTFSDFELVLADNASTDASADICRRYAADDDRVRYLPSRSNRGSAWNWNRCVAEATAPKFQWLCHDDALEPDNGTRLVAALDGAGDDVVCAYSHTLLMDAGGTVAGRYDDRLDLEAATPHERLESVMVHLELVNPLFGVYRTGVLTSTRLMQGFARADTALMVELFLRGRAVKVDADLFRRRRHDAASMVAHETTAALDRFYDPNRRSATRFPTWRLFRTYARAVAEAPLSPAERARCTVLLGKSRYRKGLWREVRALAVRAHPRDRGPRDR